MSLLYSFLKLEDGSYNFISEQGHSYLIYFFESTLPDSDGNVHTVYNLGFSRDGEHESEPFRIKHDPKIRKTITSIINNFFKLNDHKVLTYFCFGDDGYARHRNIVFNQWFADLDTSIEKYNSVIPYEDGKVYGALFVVKENSLKKLIVDSFNGF